MRGIYKKHPEGIDEDIHGAGEASVETRNTPALGVPSLVIGSVHLGPWIR